MEIHGKSNSLSTDFKEMQQTQKRINEEKLLTYKAYLPIGYDEFKALLTGYAETIMLERSVTRTFEIDKNNGPIIKQLYYYLTNNTDCAWNLNAGIILGGNVGCGKSVLMMAFLKISDQYTRKITTQIHSKLLASQLKTNGIDFYKKKPLFIDEIGREEEKAIDYGNVIKPVIDLLSMRYEYGARTYATTNFKYEKLETFYGDFIRDRMEEMMTLVILPGDSRRLKNEVKR